MYVCMCVCVYIYIYIYILLLSLLSLDLGKYHDGKLLIDNDDHMNYYYY